VYRNEQLAICIPRRAWERELSRKKIPKGYTAIDMSFTVRNQLVDALAASLSVAGSAYSGIVKNTPKFIISIVEEVESY